MDNVNLQNRLSTEHSTKQLADSDRRMSKTKDNTKMRMHMVFHRLVNEQSTKTSSCCPVGNMMN